MFAGATILGRGGGAAAAAAGGGDDRGLLALDVPLVADPTAVLTLSEEVPKILNALAGHNNRLVRLIEDQRCDAFEKQLQDVDRALDNLETEKFEPMQYLLAGTYGGESFFHPLFDLYKVLKRVRLTCPKNVRPLVERLRKRTVTDFTNAVLRDVWYVQNRGDMAADVREIKDSEKAVWVAEKFQRLQVQRAEEKAARAVLREERCQERERRHAETSERRAEWERGHLERKEKRRQDRLARAAAHAAAAAAAGGTEGAQGSSSMSSPAKRSAEGSCEGEGSAKRAMTSDGSGRMNGMPSHRGGDSPESSATDGSAISSIKLSSPMKGSMGEESKCTLSPMLYGGRGNNQGGVSSTSNAGSSNGSSSRRLMTEARDENFGPSSR